jgi:hypothetical protein
VHFLHQGRQSNPLTLTLGYPGWRLEPR